MKSLQYLAKHILSCVDDATHHGRPLSFVFRDRISSILHTACYLARISCYLVYLHWDLGWRSLAFGI
jgi:hypothetical protein